MNIRKYGLFAAIASAIVIPIVFFSILPLPDSNKQNDKSQQTDNPNLRGAVDVNSSGKQISGENRRYLCGSSLLAKNTEFIQEYQIPFNCAQPVGIAVDSQDKVWIAATWTGYLLVFDPVSESFTDFIEIPDWKTRGEFGSMVWGMEFDKSGNLWFADQNNNAIWRYFVDEERFEMYRIPTRGSYPVQIDFDSSGRIWFSEVFGKKLGVIDPSLTENNSSRGITEYEINEVEFETMGPITVSSKNSNSVWFTTVTYPEGGQLVEFDMDDKQFTVYELPKEAGVPIGIVEDRNGRLWINDHASNLFFMFDPATQDFAKYSTSLPTSRENATTLPYWNLIRDNRIWFNEHEGNAMAYFDIRNMTLVEYQIPTRGEAWGNTSNPLKFDLDSKGSAWFTEWTENKIGVLDAEKLDKLPVELSVSKDAVELDTKSLKGDQLVIEVYPNRTGLEKPVTMTVASSVSYSGKLWNFTGDFSEDVFYFDKGSNEPYSVSLILKPTKDLVPGNYSLTIGARYDTVTYNKIVNLYVK